MSFSAPICTSVQYHENDTTKPSALAKIFCGGNTPLTPETVQFHLLGRYSFELKTSNGETTQSAQLSFEEDDHVLRFLKACGFNTSNPLSQNIRNDALAKRLREKEIWARQTTHAM